MAETDAFADRFFKRLEEKIASVRPAVAEPLGAEGYLVYHTGGGCLAWYLDVGGGDHLLITYHDHIDGDPDEREWLVGRYHEEGGFVNLDETFTLAGAIETARKLPSPRRRDGSLVDMLYPSLAAALADADPVE